MGEGTRISLNRLEIWVHSRTQRIRGFLTIAFLIDLHFIEIDIYLLTYLLTYLLKERCQIT